MKPYPETISGVLDAIKQDPILVLGHKSCTRLECFIKGWQSGAYTYGNKHFPQSLDYFNRFHNYLCNKYSLPILSFSCFPIIRLIANEETVAFNLFFSEMRIFELSNGSSFDIEEEIDPNDIRLSRKDLLHHILKTPQMYLGCKSVTRLAAFLRGYEYARLKSFAKVVSNLDTMSSIFESIVIRAGYPLTIQCDAVALLKGFGNEADGFDWLASELKAQEPKW